MATIPGVLFLEGGHGDPQIPDGDWIAFGMGGHQAIFGGTGNDDIFAYGGHDTIVGGEGHDLIVSYGGHDLLIGGVGDQTLIGGGSHDTLIGGEGNQLLDGHGSSDLIIAGQGNDTMIGGGSHDTFVFGSGGGRDVVMDFHAGDVLQIQQNINGLNVQTAQDLLSHISSDGHGNSVIDLGNGDSVTLVGVQPHDLEQHLSTYVKIH